MALTRTEIQPLIAAGLRTEFDLAFRSAALDSIVGQIATTVNTSLPVQTYGWLGASPLMRAFIDERRPQGLRAYSYQLEDQTFEATIAVERRAVEDDQMDLIRMRVRDMAGAVVRHQEKLLIDLLMRGHETPAYDGVAFFGARTVGGVAHSNLSANDLSAAGLPLVMSAMMSTPDDNGQPMGVVPDTLLVGPVQLWNALEITESPVAPLPGINAPSYKNVFRGRLKVVVSPFITNDRWFLLDTSRAMRALILQQRSDVPVEFQAQEGDSGSSAAFMHDRYLYGVRGRYTAGYGLWQFATVGNLEA